MHTVQETRNEFQRFHAFAPPLTPVVLIIISLTQCMVFNVFLTVSSTFDGCNCGQA